MLNPIRTIAVFATFLPVLSLAQSLPNASLPNASLPNASLPNASLPMETAVQVPTTHVLAIGHFVRPLTPDEQRSIMPREVPDTLLLILDGTIEQGWVRKDQRGVVFLMNVTTVEEARAVLEKLPLGKAKLMEFDLMPIGPLGPLRMLLNKDSATRR